VGVYCDLICDKNEVEMLKKQLDDISLSYLKLQKPKENRGNILVFFLIFLDLLGLLPLVSVPFSYPFFLAAIIPVAILHLWAIVYIIAPYRFEHSYYLFFGVYGIINTYVFFLTIQKLLYAHIKMEGSLSFIIGSIIFIGLIIIMNWINIKALHSGTYAALQKKGNTMNISKAIFAAGIGYVLSQIILTFIFSEEIKIMIFTFLLATLSILTAYFSIFIHRYFYMKKHKDKLKQVYPDFGLPKKSRRISA
jgi:hypothetical protein